MRLPPSSPAAASRAVFVFLLGLLAALFTAGPGAAQAEPKHAEIATVSGLRPGPVSIGPIDSATGITLTPNDLIGYDDVYNGNGTNGGGILDFSVHGNNTSGAETVLASSTVGSGDTFSENMAGGGAFVAPAPSGMIYYFELNGPSSTVSDLVQLNPSTLVRTVVSAGSNTALGPTPSSNIYTLAWDFATGTVIYYDATTNGSTSAASGFYRVDPATGKRSAVSLTGGSPGSGVAMTFPTYAVTDAFGNIFYIDTTSTNNVAPNDLVEIPVTGNGNATYGARKYVSNNSVGTQNGSTYDDLDGLWIDPSQTEPISGGLPISESLILSDAGVDQTSSAIYRIPSNTGAKAVLINNANNAGPAVFDFPGSAVADTTGRIYYDELHTGVVVINYIPAGTHGDNSLTNTPNLDSSDPFDMPLVPPPTPTLATPTLSNNAGTTVTFNGSVTADGGVTNSGIISRGFVYLLSTSQSPLKIGSPGVTQIVNFQATSVPVAQNANLGAFNSNATNLTPGTAYAFAAYAQNVSGISYSTPVSFVTSAPPFVTTNSATSLTSTSAALNGDVTSDNFATLTARGFVYSSTNTMPTLGAGTPLTDSGTSTGTYSDTASSLANGTTYYFRAYATNAAGTTYGSVLNFTTIAPPTANSQSINVPFNTVTAVTLTGSDPQGQTLTYAVATQPTHGTLSGTAPNLTYTPNSGYHGTDSFTFTTMNTSGLTSSAATVTLTVAPGTPTANAQNVSVPFNTATAVTLTGTDPDSPALTLTYTVVASPAHGMLSGTAPNLTYTPTANYQGADSFTFRVSNGTNTSNTATVSITVAAGTPTANAQSVNVNLNLPATVTLTGTDPDSPALALTYTVVTQPANGTLSGTAPNLTYTPTTGFAGNDSFTFTVSNGQKTSAAATVSLTVIGEPTISAFTPASGPAGTTVTITGTNLQNATGINFFRNTAASSFALVSPTQMTAIVPSGAKSGLLTVLSGSGTNTSSTKFTVTP